MMRPSRAFGTYSTLPKSHSKEVPLKPGRSVQALSGRPPCVGSEWHQPAVRQRSEHGDSE